ncbi:MAG: type II toxin-antitoxin system HicB family antitoxin [bacterium]
MKEYTFEIVIKKEPEDEGFYAYVPSLPGCNSGGLTLEETRANILGAIRGYLRVLIEDGDPIPDDSDVEVVERVKVAA